MLWSSDDRDTGMRTVPRVDRGALADRTVARPRGHRRWRRLEARSETCEGQVEVCTPVVEQVDSAVSCEAAPSRSIAPSVFPVTPSAEVQGAPVSLKNHPVPSQEPDDAHTELIFVIGNTEMGMNPRVGAGVRSRDHRRYQFPADFVGESIAPSSGKDDLPGETVEAACHSCADLFVGKIASRPFGNDPSSETVKSSLDPVQTLSLKGHSSSSRKR